MSRKRTELQTRCIEYANRMSCFGLQFHAQQRVCQIMGIRPLKQYGKTERVYFPAPALINDALGCK